MVSPEAACWSHGRRKLFDLADIAASKRRGKNAPPISPLALEAVKRIDVLFDIEHGINGKPNEQRLALRQELSAPVLAEFKEWMQAERRELSRHSPNRCGTQRLEHDQSIGETGALRQPGLARRRDASVRLRGAHTT